MRGKRLGWAGAALIGCAACSSGNGSNAGSGGNSDGDSGGVGGGGGGPTVCDHVVLDDADLVSGFGVALASDGTDVFVLRDLGSRRVVQRLQSGQLQDVVSIDDDPMVYLGGSTLVANANGLFFDVTVGDTRAIYRAPRAGGTPVLLAQLNADSASLSPPFVADDTSLYTKALAPSGDSLARIPQTAPAGTQGSLIASGAFTSGTFYAMATLGKAVLTVKGFATVTEYSSASSSSSPADAGSSSDAGASPESGAPSEAGGSPSSESFSASDVVLESPFCGKDMDASIVASDSALFLGCAMADLSVHYIFQVPAPATIGGDASSASITQVVSGTGVNSKTFFARGTNVYYVNDADPALYRIPSGGTKVKVMATHNVAHIAATSTDLFVLSACGLQQAPL
jgi:hypothetical protein